jgi:hypothetical protein
MKHSISITIGLDEYDTKVRTYCEENQYDDPDYTTLIDRIQSDLELLHGVEQVVFNHSSWMVFDLGIDSFEKAKEETEIIKQEVLSVFEKHGVK